jgi:hypothetical protein
MKPNRGFNPRHALSPRSKWQLVDVLHEDEYWSMALGHWKEDNWRPVLAQRWNGVEGQKGNPVSHGYATWFILPDDTYKLYIDSKFIPESKRAFVKETLGVML